MANVCCSIEMEPRTLNQGQLNHAREMAADVAQKMEARQTSATLIQGLLISSGVVEVEEVEYLMRDEEKEMAVDEERKEKAVAIIGRPCQCSCNSIESPENPDHNHMLNNLKVKVKEPVTAPF